MKTALAMGKFQIIHAGHLYYLEQARKRADRLIVVVARDATIRAEGGRVIIPEKQRLAVVAALKPVDKAVLGGFPDKLKIVGKIRPDVIVLGPDQPADEKRLKRELARRGLRPSVVRVKKLKTGAMMKTSRIIRKIARMR
jgi:FAD synthetase